MVGETPNLAARLQALAVPGSVVISQATRRLLGGLFELDDLGPTGLKGFAEPLAAWRVAGEGQAEGRFEARQTASARRRWSGATRSLRCCCAVAPGQGRRGPGGPAVGRAGDRQVAPGPRAARSGLPDEPHIAPALPCSPHHTTSPLHPVIEQLERAAGFARDEPPEAQLAKLEALLARGTRPARRGGAADRRAARGADRRALSDCPTLTPQRQKQLTLAGAGRPARGPCAAQQPVLLAYEDVHWIDPTTQELLGLDDRAHPAPAGAGC